MRRRERGCIVVTLIREQGKLKESVKLLQEVLEIREKLNGSTHQTVCTMYTIHVHVHIHVYMYMCLYISSFGDIRLLLHSIIYQFYMVS